MYAICIHGNKIMASTMNTNVDIPTTLPAPNEEYDNFHTTDLYAMMMMQTELQIHAFNIKAPMVLTNNNLDCVFAFEFEVETPYPYGSEENPTKLLQSDCNGVPMLIGLGNKKNLTPILVTIGEDQNIWFDALL